MKKRTRNEEKRRMKPESLETALKEKATQRGNTLLVKLIGGGDGAFAARVLGCFSVELSHSLIWIFCLSIFSPRDEILLAHK